MSCYDKQTCNCKFNVKNYGLCDTNRIKINGSDRTALNWSEISVPEILYIPIEKPDIENIDQVYTNTDITSVKLIETPFAYDQYDILATLDQINSVIDVITPVKLIETSISDIITEITNILAIPGLPNLPIISSLQALLLEITAALSTLTTSVDNALSILVAPVTISAICAAVSAVIAALELVQTLLNQLITILNDLVTAVSGIPIIGPAVEAIVTPLLVLVNTTLTEIATSLTNILSVIIICEKTKVIVLKPNAEGTCLSGRKLVIEGLLNQKIIYTANVDIQSVHSAHYNVPFSAFIIPYAKFEGAEYTTNVPVLINGIETVVNGFVLGTDGIIQPDLCEEFCVEAYIEDIFAYDLDKRTIFKNVTLFLQAKVSKKCS